MRNVDGLRKLWFRYIMILDPVKSGELQVCGVIPNSE